MWIRFLAAAAITGALATAQVPVFSEHVLIRLGNESVSGYAIEGSALAAWGSRLLWRRLPLGVSRVVSGGGRTFSEGGCFLDVDGDGQADIVVNESSPAATLAWFRSSDWSRHVIDTGIDAPDILPATLFGRRGILLIQKRIQVRFYEIPANPARRWPSQEIYSFYSPSHQGGLAIADIDGDGRPDILVGNYWIRSPEAFEIPWRLFAIEPWNEMPASAMLRLLYAPLSGAGPELVIAQREMHHARLSRFEKPSDPRQLWIEHPIGSVPDLNQPNSLDAADFDGDGRLDIVVAERAGRGRILVFHNDGGGHFTPKIVAQGRPVEFARAADLNGDGRPDILVIRRDVISWYENRPARPEHR